MRPSLDLLSLALSSCVPAGSASAPAALPMTPTARWHPQFSTVVTSGGRVVSASDLQGLAGVTEGAAGIGPQALTDALGRKFWRFQGASFLNVAAELVGSNQNFSIFLVGRTHVAGPHKFFGLGNVAGYGSGSTAVNTSGAMLDTSISGGLAPYLRSASKGAQLDATNGKKVVAGSQLQVMGALNRTTANGAVRLYLNNDTASVAQANAATGVVGAEIGRYPYAPGSSGTWAQFDLYEMVVYNSGLTNAAGDAVAAALVSYYSIPAIISQLVLEGDSISAGSGIASGNGPGMVMTEPGASLVPSGWRVVNMATSGNKVPDLVMRRDAASGWPTILLSGSNVMAFEIGRNDMVGTGAVTPAQHYANVVAYLNTTTTGILQRGWTVRELVNIAGAGAYQTDNETFRGLITAAQFLTDTLTNTGQTYDGKLTRVRADLITLAASGTLFLDATDAADTLYYQGDSTHPSILGAIYRANGADTPQYGIGYGLV